MAVVGTSDESTASFLSLLVRGDADVDRQMPAPGEVLGWTLDTKYYVADVACVFHALPGAYLGAQRDGDAAARDASLAREMAAGAEALVLCYDPLDENAFAAVASFAADVAEAAGDGDRPEVRVLVGLYRDAAGVVRRDPNLKNHGTRRRRGRRRGYEGARRRRRRRRRRGGGERLGGERTAEFATTARDASARRSRRTSGPG